MGLIVKRNKKGEYSLTSSISDESLHPEKKWISIDEAKVILIEEAFYKFIADAIEIDMTFPNRYYVNDKRQYDSSMPNFHEWHLSIMTNEYGKKLFARFNELLAKHDLDLSTDIEEYKSLKEEAEAYTNKALSYDSTPPDSNKSETYEWVMNAYIAGKKANKKK